MVSGKRPRRPGNAGKYLLFSLELLNVKNKHARRRFSSTLMGEMKSIKTEMDARGLRAELMVGGAVVTADNAESISAYHSKYAVGAAAAAKKPADIV
jgi:hypothetical protein